MTPCEIVFYHPNHTLVNAEHVRNLSLLESGLKKFSYFTHSLFCKFCHSVGFTDQILYSKNIIGMSDVFLMRYPFEIFDPIIASDSVLMVNASTGLVMCQKSRRNKAAYISSRAPEIPIKDDDFSITFTQSRPEDSWWMVRGMNIPPDSTVITYRIKRSIRYCLPKLYGGINFIRHLCPFSLRLQAFRCGLWFNGPQVVPPI